MTFRAQQILNYAGSADELLTRVADSRPSFVGSASASALAYNQTVRDLAYTTLAGAVERRRPRHLGWTAALGALRRARRAVEAAGVGHGLPEGRRRRHVPRPARRA